MMKIKQLLLIFFLLVTSIGCAGKVQVRNNNRIPDLVLFVPSGKEAGIVTQAVKTFEKQQALMVNILTASDVDFSSQLWASLLSKSNQWDAVLVPTEAIPQMVEYQGIKPFAIQSLPSAADPGSTAVGLTKVVEDVTVAGQGYGLPVQYDVPVLIYRKDVLDQLKMAPPQDWQGLLKTIEAINHQTGKKAYVVAPGEGMGGFDFAIYLVGFGGFLLNEHGESGLLDPQSGKAFEYYVQLVRNHELVPPEAVKWGSQAAVAQLRTGNATLGIVWLSDALSLTDCKQSPQVCADGKTKFALSPLPGIQEQGDKIMRTYLRREKAWVIAANTRHEKAAQSFLGWLASDEGRQAWVDAGGAPFDLWTGSADWTESARPDLAYLANALPDSVGLPAVIDPDEFWSPIHEMVSDAVTGKKTGDQALLEAAQKVQALLVNAGNVP